MKYYKVNNEVMAIGEAGDIDGDQSFLVQSDWKLMTAEEVDAHINPPKTEAIILAEKISEAKAYLSSTDFKMTVDYFATLTEVEKLELTAKRAEARALV